VLLHGFEQGALDLGRRAIDLVGEISWAKIGPCLQVKTPVAWVVDHGADQVGGEQVGGELDAPKVAAIAWARVFTASVLARPGTPFEKYVAPGEEPDQQAVDEVTLPDDDGPDLLAEAVEEGRTLLDAVVHGRDAGIHGEVGIAENGGP
jgi:hypothetical protein